MLSPSFFRQTVHWRLGSGRSSAQSVAILLRTKMTTKSNRDKTKFNPLEENAIGRYSKTVERTK